MTVLAGRDLQCETVQYALTNQYYYCNLRLELPAKMTKMVCRDTLLFKNLPPELSDVEKQDFLTHFGAKNIKIITSNYRQKSKAFAKFESEEVAKNVMNRLHQMTILGTRLSVEYAEEEIGCEKVQNVSHDKDVSKHFKTFLNKLNSWNHSVAFNQPPPPHLKYLYPKPNRATISNIGHALATVPKFYTQVLHLMNRMNLPPPFSNIPDPPPEPAQTSEPPKESTSESEYESDPDELQRPQTIIPEKRKKPQRKPVKKPKFIKPPTVVPTPKTAQSTDDVFEKVNLNNQKKIELKVSDSLETKPDSLEIEQGFGIIPSQKPEKPPDDSKPDNAETETGPIITEKELVENRILPKDFGVLPVFKDYHAGAPSCRLYIKNLAKNVEVKDLEYVYKRYELPESEIEQGNMFDVRLMQEGRMKGQAFITLQNVTQAQKAVKETNGYILKNKPLVVVFARSAVPKSK